MRPCSASGRGSGGWRRGGLPYTPRGLLAAAALTLGGGGDLRLTPGRVAGGVLPVVARHAALDGIPGEGANGGGRIRTYEG